MSEFALKYWELSSAAKETKNLSGALSNCARDLRNQSAALSGQSGFGIPTLRSQISSLAAVTGKYPNNVISLGNFLSTVENEVRNYESNAYNVLSGAEPKKERTFWQTAGAAKDSGVFQAFKEAILAALGEDKLLGGDAALVNMILGMLENGIDIQNGTADLKKLLAYLTFDSGKPILEYFIEEMLPKALGEIKVKAIKGGIADWVIDWLKGTYENFNTEGLSNERALLETFSEALSGAVPAAGGALATWGVWAAFAAILGATPVGWAAVAVAGIGAVAAWGVKKVLDKIAGDDWTENVGDWIADNLENVGDWIVDNLGKAAGAIKDTGKAIADWWSGLPLFA